MGDSFFIMRAKSCAVWTCPDCPKFFVQPGEKAVRTTHRTHNMKTDYAEKFSITVQVLSHARESILSNFCSAGVMSKSSEPEASVPRSR